MKLKKYLDHFKRIIALFGDSKKYIPLLIIGFVISGLLDIVGIGLIGPFIALFLDYERSLQAFPFLSKYEFTDVVIIASTILIIVFFTRIVAAFFVNSFILKVAFDRQVIIRSQAIQSIHDQDYVTRLEKTTGQFATLIISYCAHYTSTVISSLRMAAELISITFIICLLMVTDIYLFLLTLVFAGSILGASAFFFSSMFIRYGEIKNEGLREFTDAVNDSLNGFKEIKILKIGKFFKAKVISGAKKAASAEEKLYLYSIVPRYFIEFLLVIIVTSSLIYSVFVSGSVTATISSLSIFLVAAVRLLPSLNAIFSSFNTINVEMDAVINLFDEIKEIKKLPQNNNESIFSEIDKNEFEDFSKINLTNLSFSYGSNKIISNLDLEINKGDFIGLLGKSGEGKTTLVDLILGIHHPSNGNIYVDGNDIKNNLEDWQKNLAYLPQEAFLINGTIEENIAIGEVIDDQKRNLINESITKAGLGEVVNKMDLKTKTGIGDRGLMLSGGQRQRIALARAFYKNKKFFIFDESTSALDASSADRILNEINRLSEEGATIILISHNQATIKRCARKLELKSGSIQEIND